MGCFCLTSVTYSGQLDDLWRASECIFQQLGVTNMGRETQCVFVSSEPMCLFFCLGP